MIFAQTSQDAFGKNRIQYQKFKWEVISTDNFDIYFYKQSQAAAVLAARYAEAEYERITDILGYAPYSRTKLVVYAANSDMQQSNIGLSNQQVFIGGYSVFLKNRVEVAFNSVQTDFTKDIAKGISGMIINEMLYGGNIKEVLQSTYFMSLPEWYLSGLTEYVSQNWTTENDDKIRDIFTNKKFKNPNRFSGDEARIIGLSIWNFVAQRYGKQIISNIISSTKYSRNYESSFAFNTSMDYKYFLKSWKNYYLEQNILPLKSLKPPADSIQIIRNPKDETFYGSIHLSPDGSRLSYVQNKKGRYKVIVKNLKTGSKNVVYRGGYRTFDQKVDYNMPVLAWRSNNKLGIVNVKQDKMKLITYDIKQEIETKKEKIRLEISNFFNIKYSQKQTYRGIYKHFKQVNDFNFNEDGSMVVISGENVMGQSDIFLYNLRNNNVTKVTNDIYDDRNPQFLSKSSKSFVFSSNRTTDSLQPLKKYDYQLLSPIHDIFLYNIDTSKTLAKRLTNTPKFNEQQPKVNRFGDIFYLSDESGINQLYKTNLKDTNKHVLSAFRQGMQNFDVNERESSLAFITYHDGKNRIFLDTNFNSNNYNDSLWIKTYRQQLIDVETINQEKKKVLKPKSESVAVKTQTELIQERKKKQLPKDTTEIDIDNYIFEFEKVPLVAKSSDSTSKKVQEYVVPSRSKILNISLRDNQIYVTSPVKYKNDFAIDNLTSGIRVDPIRGFGLTFAASLSDLMGNHRINAGLFAIFDFRTSVMWAEYEYLKRRTDFKFKITKDVISYRQGNALYHRYAFYKLETAVSYPFNPSMKVSLSPFLGWTNFTNLFPSKSYQSIEEVRNHYVGASAEYVFDNARIVGTNSSLGTKIRFGYTQYFGVDSSILNFGKIYFDIRNYTKIHRELVFATRLAGGSFMGAAAKKFMLGGMDNWVLNSVENPDDKKNPLNQSTQDFGNTDLFFHEFATNLRGFKYANQFGNNYVMANFELRLQIFKYLIRRQIKSNFLRNFQTIAFFDAGAAWTGQANPFSDNSNNTETIAKGPFTAQVRSYRNPFLLGYGFGVRTMIFGYYAKLDCAWGVKDFNNQGIRLYFTLGYDF